MYYLWVFPLSAQPSENIILFNMESDSVIVKIQWYQDIHNNWDILDYSLDASVLILISDRCIINDDELHCYQQELVSEDWSEEFTYNLCFSPFTGKLDLVITDNLNCTFQKYSGKVNFKIP